jgi:biotin transport system substrate-specific component
MKTKDIVLCGLFAALTAILSQLAIPIGPVPINLATFSVLLAGALLPFPLGGVSMLAYIALGAFGLPVFSMMRGGLAIVAGPTGGYIVGYAVCALLTGLLSRKPATGWGPLLLAMLAGYLALMMLGTAWFMFLTHSGLAAALAACVLPFLPGDTAKLAAAAVVAVKARPILARQASA